MLNGTNMLGKDNPRWGISNAKVTIRVPDGHLPSSFGALATVGIGYGRSLAWLVGLPRRAGRRLFAMNDAEAGWHRWQISELRGGLARSYHDPRFSPSDPPAIVHRRPGDWDDVHGWPWDGEG